MDYSSIPPEFPLKFGLPIKSNIENINKSTEQALFYSEFVILEGSPTLSMVDQELVLAHDYLALWFKYTSKKSLNNLNDWEVWNVSLIFRPEWLGDIVSQPATLACRFCIGPKQKEDSQEILKTEDLTVAKASMYKTYPNFNLLMDGTTEFRDKQKEDSQ